MYSIRGFPSFTRGIATAEVSSGIPKVPPLRTRVSGSHHDSIFIGSKTAAVEEPRSIYLKSVSSVLPPAFWTNLVLIASLELFLHIFATVCGIEFGDRFLFGGDRLVAAIDRGLLNQAEEMIRWWRNCKRHRRKTCPSKDTAGCEGLIEIAMVI